MQLQRILNEYLPRDDSRTELRVAGADVARAGVAREVAGEGIELEGTRDQGGEAGVGTR